LKEIAVKIIPITINTIQIITRMKPNKKVQVLFTTHDLHKHVAPHIPAKIARPAKLISTMKEFEANLYRLSAVVPAELKTVFDI
jgi:DNA repair photolyase